MTMADDLYDKLKHDLLEARENGVNYQTAKAELWQAVWSDQERHLRMFFNNWFNSNWARQINETNGAPKPPKSYKRRKPTAQEQRERRKRDANNRGVTLMNMFLSDGETRLKDATGAQVRGEFGWLKLIAKFVKPTEIVGKKLTAQQLFNLKEQSIKDGARWQPGQVEQRV
jgi:hypothetical protein